MAEFESAFNDGDFQSANYSDVSGSMEMPAFQGKLHPIQVIYIQSKKTTLQHIYAVLNAFSCRNRRRIF